MSALSYQGISDRVAYEYMERHGQATWSRHRKASWLDAVTCPKLQSYWHFHDCRYDKTSRTCAEPCHIDQCPLPTHHLRNGRLNQTAYSLYLFIRDIADGDLVGWIDSQLKERRRSDRRRPPWPHARGADRAVAPSLRRCRQSTHHGVVVHSARRPKGSSALDRGWRQHDCHRYAGAQLSAPHRHPAKISMQTTPMVQPATRLAAAPTSSPWWPSRSTPGHSIPASRPCFRGSSSTRFGGTALNPASTSATAIASMIASHAQIYTVDCTVFVIVFASVMPNRTE